MVKNICLVDDETDLTGNLALEINELHPDWKIMTFQSGLDAVREIMKGQIDCVVTDIAMPDLDGYELFWRIKDYNSELPVIMMTGFGYDPNHVLVRSKQEGLQDIIYKPFDIRKLVALIEQRLS
jgi:DNA-binding response OmpR family regulator